MNQLLIRGGRPLQGTVEVQGAKNAVLPILAATILTGGQVTLRRCPHLSDVEASIDILRALGCTARWEGEDLTVDTTTLTAHQIRDELMRKMRSSAIFLGAILGRCGEAELSYPGGCELGPRPIDLHLRGLKELGATVEDTGGQLRCTGAHLTGKRLTLDFPSVGATENLMLCACAAEGTTVIENAAREPEIEDLQNFLNACGAHVSGAGTSAIVVEGKKALHGCTYTVMPDRIVTATWLCACAAAGGEIGLYRARPEHLSTVISALRQSGCIIEAEGELLRCRVPQHLRAISRVRTAPYPGFPTDAQAILMAALAKGRGTTVFEENIFENRYRHVDELIRMGANIRVSGRAAVVEGVQNLHGTAVRCTDLRGGAALCAAALGAEGESTVTATHHIDRGYEDMARDLKALGADITRQEE